LDGVLADVERVGAIVLGIKYYLSIDRLEIVRYEITAERYYLNR